MLATDKQPETDKDRDADPAERDEKNKEAAAARAKQPEKVEVLHRVATGMRRVLVASPRLPYNPQLSRPHQEAMVDLFIANRGVDEGERELSGGARMKRLNRALEVLAPVLATALSPEVAGGYLLHADLEAKVAKLRARIADRIAVEGVAFSNAKPAAKPTDDEPAQEDAAEGEQEGEQAEAGAESEKK